VARYNKILEPGRTVGVGPWSKIRLQPAVHHVEFLLDPGWQIQESDETDNHREFDVTCK
jgi:subtilase family serine protease